MNRIRILIKNIRLLSKMKLWEMEYELKKNIFDDICYEVNDEFEPELNILNYQETVDKLLLSPKSFCRFGDGEMEIIKGNNIPFQKYDKKLAEKMEFILKNNVPNLYVGINYNYFHSTRNLLPFAREFSLEHASTYRKAFIEYSTNNREYIAAGFNQIYMLLKDYDFETYYDKIKTLFKDKKVVLFIGKGIKNKFKYNVFEEAKSIECVEGPNVNAFDEYKSLLAKAVTYDKDNILCFILWPTSKILVYDLSQLGYLAYDIGHLMKDYDAYMKRLPRDKEGIIDFYRPD